VSMVCFRALEKYVNGNVGVLYIAIIGIVH